MKLPGRVAVVTGGALGVGKGIARAFAGAGAQVVVADRDAEAGRRTVAELEAGGGSAALFELDTTNDEHVLRLVRELQERLGGIDVWVNNAGPEAPTPFYPEGEGWRQTLDGYLRAVLSCTQVALRALERRGGGAIVNIASGAGVGYGAYAFPEYAVAKAGILRLTSCLASQRAARNVRVNCIAPGWVATEAVLRNVAHMTPSQKAAANVPEPMLTPDDVGWAAVELVRRDGLAGRILLYPEPGRRRLIPVDLDLFALAEELGPDPVGIE